MRSAPLVIAIAVGLGLAATTQTTAAIQAPASRATDQANNGMYIVTFTEAPLARYAGGALDTKTNRVMAATTPTVAGGRKLNVHSIESRNYLGFLAERRHQHLADASARIGRPLAAKFVYDAVLNGVAVQMTPAEAERVRGMPGIAKVEADFKRHVTTDRGPQWIHADKIWDGTATAPSPGNHGEGIVIGVIDTGVNRTHPSFSGAGLTNPRGQFYGLCASNASLCNNKLIGIYDFTTGSGDAEPNDGLDNVGHGSHTASTAAGAPVDYTIPLSTGPQVVHTHGVAYGANLITYKACEDQSSCQGTWLIAGLNQAVLDGVDVISFSIGGGLDDPWTDSDTTAMLDARAGGTVVAVAAGNDGPNAGTLTSPSNAPWVLSVAATSHDRIYANKLDLSGGSTAPPNGGVLVGAADTVGTGVLDIVRANPVLCDEGSNTTGTAGENKPAAWNSTTYPNKMVICDRGIYPRVSKSANVKLAGGAAMILLNQASDGDSLVPDAHTIPSTHLGYNDSQSLLAWFSTGTGHKGKLEGSVITHLDSQGDNLASFSGRGPVDTPAGVLKPDVTAPGVQIIAASNIGAGFNTFDGTSMATPHTAGAAALIMKAHPTWGPSEVISALIGTARPSNKVGNNQIGTPFDQGAGTLDLAKAVRAGLSFDISQAGFLAGNPASGGVPHDLNLPSLTQENCFEQCNLTRTVRDLVGGGTWTVTTNVPGAVVTPSATSFTLANNGTKALSFGIDVRVPASMGKWVFGTVTLHPTFGTNIPDTVMPLSVFVSAGATQPPIKLNVPSESGFHDVTFSGLVALPDASFGGSPLVPVAVKDASVGKDSSGSDPFNTAAGTSTLIFTAPEAPDHSPRKYRISVDATADATITDIDLYVGQDADGNGKGSDAEKLCVSADAGAVEHCEFDFTNPGGGAGPVSFWAVAQNFSGPTGNLHIEAAAVPLVVENQTLTVTGPGQLARLATGKMRVIWNDPSMVTGAIRKGFVIVGAAPGSEGLLIPVTLTRTGTTAAAFALQNAVPHAVSLGANTAQDRIYFDVPKNATQVQFKSVGSGSVTLYAAHVDNPTGPVIAPAPPRGSAQASSVAAGGNQTITLTGAAVLPGRWYVTAVNTATTGVPADTTITATVTAGTAPVNYVGTAFYDPNRSGAGIYINPDASGYPEMDWYTYDEDGSSTWYIADFNRVVDTGNAGQIWGDLQRVSMGANGKQLTKVGTVAISLIDDDELVYTYNLNGESGSSHMTRLGTHTCPTLSAAKSTTTGLWYPPAHDGIGQSLIVNNHDEYYAVYVYDAAGNPRWAYAEAPLDAPPAALATRTLTAQQLHGSCPQCAYSAPTSTNIGSFTRTLLAGGISSIGYNFTFVAPLSGVWNETHPVIRISQPYTCP